MALMFSRLARNFIKNGYFPTDAETLQRILRLLQPSEKPMRLLDPCCGEGAALADLAQSLAERSASKPRIDALGIEFDRERAWHAKNLLTRAIHADVHDVIIKPRSISALFLNPPYGFGVSDGANARQSHERAERLERTFLKKTVPWLMPGGVLIYIVPYYALDGEIRSFLARNFTGLRFWMAPEQQFKQCVIFGIKARSIQPRKETLEMLCQAQAGQLLNQVLPESWDEELFKVPAIVEGSAFDFHAVRMDGEQLADELRRWQGSLLWNGFEACFNQARAEHRRPLREMTKWHLALALAAGQVTGCIRSKTGRIFLVKGDTFKKKERIASTDVDEQGNVSQTIVMLDKFVPAINAIEFTPDHRLGQIVKIN